MPQDDSHVGKKLAGRYLILQELGRGAHGAVYLARDEEVLSRRVVVKILQEHFREDEYVRRKFEQEVEALARVRHGGVVAVLGRGETPAGLPYFVMEYVEGHTLRSILRPEGIDLRRAASIIEQIGAALGAVHDNGVFHRDLKPENIMLQTPARGGETVKLIDFGVAKIRHSSVAASTAPALAVGTPYYMAPEQLEGRDVTAASDVFSLGVIAYEMVTGRRPFNPASAYLLPEMHRRGVQVRPKDLREELPDVAQEEILRALSHDPRDRRQSAPDFGDYMARALTAHLETAGVLFLDIVSYSKQATDRQPRVAGDLKEVVLKCAEVRRAREADEVILRPTGDGMALVFFTRDPAAPARCALEIADAVRGRTNLPLRMGIHSGPVYRVLDVNGLWDVAGDGINDAQRVMDCGEQGHILISGAAAAPLSGHTRWAGRLRDLGDYEVKHGRSLRIFNLNEAELGNRERPRPKRGARRGDRLHASLPAFRRPPGRRAAAVAASCGALLLLAAAAVKLWPVLRGEVVPPLPPPAAWEATHTLRGHADSVYSVAFSPDGTALVSGSYDGTARLWDVPTGLLRLALRRKGAPEMIYTAAVFPDGERVVACVNKDAVVWELRTGKVLKTFQHAGLIFSVAVSPDGARLATGGEGKEVALWDAGAGARLKTLPHPDEINSVAFSPDGAHLASGAYDGKVRLWDARTGEPRGEFAAHTDHVNSVAFSPDGARLATGGKDGAVSVWGVRGGDRLILKEAGRAAINSVAFSHDGSAVAAAGSDGKVAVWDVRAAPAAAAVQTLAGHYGEVFAVAFSPDGMHLATGGGKDATVILWRVKMTPAR